MILKFRNLLLHFATFFLYYNAPVHTLAKKTTLTDSQICKS